MKIRTDFVTNSSSSSFILARKGELNERQKIAVFDVIANKVLGKVMLTPEHSEEEIQKKFDEEYVDEDMQEKIRQALQEGKTVYSGWVSFEECEYSYGEFFETIWKELENNSEDTFTVLDGDLSY